MFFNVRCFKCGEDAARVILGGRSILHAQCMACDSNLLKEVIEFEKQVLRESASTADEPQTAPIELAEPPVDETLEEDTAPAG